ncbi:MAG: hypothetical protein WCL54_06130 [Clostridia bacterium]
MRKMFLLLAFTFVLLVGLVGCNTQVKLPPLPTSAPQATTDTTATTDPNVTTDPNATGAPAESTSPRDDVKTVAFTWGQDAKFITDNAIPAPTFLANNVTNFMTTAKYQLMSIKNVTIAEMDTYVATLEALGFTKTEWSTPEGKAYTLQLPAKKLSVVLSVAIAEDSQGTITFTEAD